MLQGEAVVAGLRFYSTVTGFINAVRFYKVREGVEGPQTKSNTWQDFPPTASSDRHGLVDRRPCASSTRWGAYNPMPHTGFYKVREGVGSEASRSSR